MGESDGGVLLDVNLSVGDAEKELGRLRREALKLEETLSFKGAKLDNLTKELDQARAKLAELQAEIKMDPSSGKFLVPAETAQQISRLKISIQEMEVEQGKLTRDIEETNAKLATTKQRYGEVADAAKKLPPETKQTESLLGKVEKRLTKLAARVLFFSVFTAALRSLKGWMVDVIKTDKDAVAAIAQLKGALLTLVQPLVGVVIPAFTAFVQVLTRVISALAAVMSAVFGTTAEESADAAAKLNDEKTALEGVGAAAKKAGKDLAGFDEINKLSGDTAGGVAGSKIIAPDFSALKELPEWLENLVAKLNFTIADLFFDFDDLTEEDILAKIVAGLTTLTGAAIGFAIGGPGGALLGTIAGVALGLVITNLTFDGDGKISQEEIAKLLISALFILAGGVLGFMAGGPQGALLGITAGAAVSLKISDLIFNNDNVLSAEEIALGLSVVLGALAGGVVGFAVGGPGGALLGAIVGAGIMLKFSSAIFNNDGVLSQEEVLTGIASMLFALAGGIIGFFVGGPAGATLGAMIGFGAVALFSSMIFDNDGVVSQSEAAMGLCTVLGALLGGIVGFFAGGPGGALLGATIGTGAVVLLTDLVCESGGKVDKDKFLQGLAAVLGAVLGGVIGFAVGGPGGALLGAVIGLGISLAVSSVDTSSADKSIRRSAENWTKSNKDISIKSSVSSISDRMASSIPSIETSDIPHFAKGAVIPPNREFAAILGDQTHGNNLEGPEDLFRRIVREESGAGGDTMGIISILQQLLAAVKEGKIMMVDDDVFARVVHESNEQESSRLGVPLVSMR